MAIFIYSDPLTFPILSEKIEAVLKVKSTKCSEGFLSSAAAQPPVQIKQVV